MFDIYVAACVEEGGIVRCVLHEDGTLERRETYPMPMPMYLAWGEDRIHTLLRDPWKTGDSALTSCPVYADGTLGGQTPCLSTKGKVACHLAVEGETVWCVNYSSGSVIRMPDRLVQHTGCGPHPTRQTGPHTHFAGFTPDRRYLCVTDLGLDTIFIYDRQLNPVSSAKVPAGHGVRHLEFSEDGKYCYAVNELESTLSVFSMEAEKLILLDTVSCLPEGSCESCVAAVRRCGDRLYVSNRGHNSVSVFALEGAKATLLGAYPCGGNWPRDILVVGDFLLCANEYSHNVSVLDLKTMQQVFSLEKIPAPLCLLSRCR